MIKPKFTIITVCYNAEQYIEDTIMSVLSQTSDDYQYMIKDGNSTDATMNIVKRLLEDNDKVNIIAGDDGGIYDAMNIAIKDALGEYLIFLNAGDSFFDNNVLSDAEKYIEINRADIYYGNIIEMSKNGGLLRTYTKKNSKLWYYSIGACICHQGMFCNRELFAAKMFDTEFKVCADREWQMYMLNNHAVAQPLGFTVAKVLTEGYSKDHVYDLDRETDICVKKYCGIWYVLYVVIRKAKKNKLLLRIIQSCELKISCKQPD
jgi:glycosyltransferase involved in cell wall biosynthesis